TEIGLNIFIARKTLGINHVDLVKMTSVTRPIISSIEKGSSNPTFDSILKLSKALQISDEMLTMTQIKYNILNGLLKQTYANYIIHKGQMHIPKTQWSFLNKYYDADVKKYSGKVAQVCRQVIQINHPNTNKMELQNIMLGAVLGVVYQNDGFENGLLFGAWLGNKLK
ncbi:MAG: helix-turn-helix transcriptional regulator, partial [Melioribacteraceae bacterium]|nr:helix-turn-helix transcriptional regulator [Melioribacteraceae bacterium]